MGKDDNSRDSKGYTWEYELHKWKRAAVWALGALLKLSGVFAIIIGLLTIALANMDLNPDESILWGTVITIVGFLMLYCGIKIAKKVKRI